MQNMIDINVKLLQWSIVFLIKKAFARHAWLENLQLQTVATRATRNKFAGSGIKNENILNK